MLKKTKNDLVPQVDPVNAHICYKESKLYQEGVGLF